MNKKKYLVIIIVSVAIVITLIAGTIAYLFTSANNNNINGSAEGLQLTFTNDGTLSGALRPVNGKTEDIVTTVTVGLANNDNKASINIYIDVTTIDAVLASDALVWEIYKDDVFYKRGTFTGASTGNKFYLINNYELTKTEVFKVYVWLDGSSSGNSSMNSSF